MSITLINHSGRCLAVNLPHAEVCAAGRCFCTTLPGPRPQRVCGSITLPAGAALTGQPEALRAAPELQALVRRGDLEVRVTPEESTPEASKKPRRKRGDTPS